ncbi:MAG: CDP-alcohol phosphatidyltransferase family protein [Pseudomonadota bacterium]
MLDPLARQAIDPPLNAAGAWLARTGVSANALTWSGFAIGLGAMAALSVQAYWIALALILTNRLFDGLDGALARQLSPTDYGAFLDILLDMLTYSGLVFAFAFGRPEHALMAAFLITTFVGTGCSFLTFAVLATKRGIETEQRGRKSFYHAAGLAEGTESILFCCAMCLFPQHFALLAGLFATMCLITTVGRIHMARQLFDGGSSNP